MRLYVTPGADHMGMGAPSGVDMLQVLVDWAEKGKAPGELVQASLEPQPPFAVTSERPMCRYPAFPRYVGGSPRLAQSFRCSAE
jgi:feruloyl esterase